MMLNLHTQTHRSDMVHHLQVRHILACAELYLPPLHTLQQEQCALAQQLQQPVATERAGAYSLLVPVLDASTSTAADAVLDAFASNLKKQHVLRAMLCAFVCGELSTLQRARAAVYSHPLFLDVHAMVCVLAQDRMAAVLAAGQQPRYVFQHRWQHNVDLQGLVLPQQQATAAASAVTVTLLGVVNVTQPSPWQRVMPGLPASCVSKLHSFSSCRLLHS
jgi:hypothetical protein